MNSSDEDALKFIIASFPSVWTLEVLLALRQESRFHTREELVSTLRASELIVSRAVDSLAAAGLAAVENDQVVYLPVNDEVDKAVRGAEQLYRSRPNTVRRAIVAAGNSGAAAFANAFKLRRDRDD